MGRDLGNELEPEELRRIQQLVSRLGADPGDLRIAGRAVVTFGGGARGAQLAARRAIHEDEVLGLVVRTHASTGTVPDELAMPLARSGSFKNGDEAAAAIEQSLADAQRRGAVEVDRAIVEEVGRRTGEAVDRVLQVEPQHRWTHVMRKDLLVK